MNAEQRKHFVEKISTTFGIVWVCIGLVAGIIFPMIYMVPMLFSSWALFGSIGHNSWANSYLMIDYGHPIVFIPLFTFEGIIFFTGLLVFLFGLGQLVKGKLHMVELVTDGIYKYIRHPQNLGILLMILPVAIFLPFKNNGYWIYPGIRLGNIMSWILMVALMCISSLIEEKILISKLGEQYLEYRSKTGLMLPKLRKKVRKSQFTLWKSVVLILGVYILIVAIIFGLYKLLLELELVFWTRTF